MSGKQYEQEETETSLVTWHYWKKESYMQITLFQLSDTLRYDTNASLCAWHTVMPSKSKYQEFEAEKGLLQDHARRLAGSAQKNQNSLTGFS